MRMKKIVSFEFGDENEQYSRVSFRLDLRVLAAILAALVIFFIVLLIATSSSSGHRNESDSAKQHETSIGDFNPETTYSTSNVSTSTQMPSTTTAKYDHRMVKRLGLIESMTLEVWKQQNAFISKEVKSRNLIQMLSTLWVMGLREEFEEGKLWIETNYYNDDFEFPVNTFVVATEYIGSLLSCFALTNDTKMLDKAKQIGDRLKIEFDTPTGLPTFRMTSNQTFVSTDAPLSFVGGQHLELVYLADMTNDLDMKSKVRNARTFLQNVEKPHNGLYMSIIDMSTGQWTIIFSSMFFYSQVFYQYLIKSYVQSDGKDEQAIEMYKDAMDAVVNNSVIGIQNGSFFAHHYYPYSDKSVSVSNYDGCYLGGMLALGADEMQRDLDKNNSIDTKRVQQEQSRIAQHWTMAKNSVEMCQIVANKTDTIVYKRRFSRHDISFVTTDALAESYFVLWRLTHDVKYRDYAWELAQAIYEHYRTLNGEYYRPSEITQGIVINNIEEQSKLHYLSSTLKYLYLTFSEDSLLPLDQWVFNRVGQALPVCGKNPAYPAQKCTYK